MASPLLMLPLHHQRETHNLCLFSLKHKKSYQLNADLHNLQAAGFRCVGSSHGWLSFVDDENFNPFLLNPFSRTRIQLPRKQTLPRIQKVVLSANPSHANNYAVIVMYEVECKTKLAYCRRGDEKWSDFQGQSQTYYDVVCCDDQTKMMFALGPGPSVEEWDLNETIPKRKMMIDQEYCSCPRILAQAHQIFPSDLYSSQWYLALSLGKIFLVVRYIGEFVRYDGEVVYEADTLTDYAAEPLVCPYKTVAFHVYKLDLDGKNWIEVKSLNDLAMFVGGNQSMMVSTKENPELKRNSIYFTDDYWDRMDEDYSYGGHDIGIFNLEDGSIEPILDSQKQRIEPPPFWISVPHDYHQ